ncbi:MAG: hypothetical protein J2O47_10605, partial [Acidimicrobiaceae bacterium]|nr:hypothetical protein [Acidimicrobiaceae bacterium]
MDDCCGLTHRTFQQLSTAGTAAELVEPLVTPAPADGSAGFYAQDLELVTVTDTSFILTWFTGST